MQCFVTQVGRELRAPDGSVARMLDCPTDWEKRDPDLIAWLAQETVTAGHSVLVFCATKRVRLCLVVSLLLHVQSDVVPAIWRPGLQRNVLFARHPVLAQ